LSAALDHRGLLLVCAQILILMKYFRLIPFLAAAFCFGLPLHAELVDGIKAVVNRGVVTLAEVDDFAAPAAKRCGRNMPASRICSAKTGRRAQ